MKRIFNFLMIFFVFSVFSCSGGIQEMLDDYNSNFTPYEEENFLPGQEGFNEKEMLALIYQVPSVATMCLVAPEVADAKYEWKITDANGEIPKRMDGGEIDLAKYQKNHLLILYIPEVGLKDGSYLLQLNVIINQGGEEKKFSDTCELVIYKDIMKL